MQYGATNDLAFCPLCMMGTESGKFSILNESALIFSGFSNCKMLPDVLTSTKEV